MKKVLVLLLAMVVNFTACGVGDSDGGDGAAAAATEKSLVSIAISANNIAISPSATKQFVAVGTFDDGSSLPFSNGLTWTSTDNTVATVSATGMVTGISEGKTFIIASSDSIDSNTETVNVNDLNITSISVTPNDANISKDDTQQYRAEATYSDGSTSTISSSVTWSVSNSNATINNLGLCSAVTSGNVTIMAALDSVNIPGEANLTINNQALTSVDIISSGLDIRINQVQQLSAQATYTDPVTFSVSTSLLVTGVIWESNSSAIATVSTLGEVTGVSEGSATITATYNGVSDSQIVTIVGDVLVDFEVTPADLNVTKGRTGTVRALATYKDENNETITFPVSDVTWITDNINIATVDFEGTVTGTGEGTAIITGSYNGSTAISTVVVVSKDVISISVTPATKTITLEEIIRLEANATLSDGSTEDISSSATWVSADTNIATVSDVGIVSPVSSGTVVISASSDGITGTASITVDAKALESISITPDAPSISSDGIVQLTVTGIYSDLSESNLTSVSWLSSDTNITTVSASGGLIQAQGNAGTATITASYTDSNNTVYTDTTLVTVTADVLNNIIISIAGSDNNISVNEIDYLSAEGNYTDGMGSSTIVALDNIIWGTSDRNISTVNFQTGEIEGVNEGNVTITVNHTSGISESVFITVIQ